MTPSDEVCAGNEGAQQRVESVIGLRDIAPNRFACRHPWTAPAQLTDDDFQDIPPIGSLVSLVL
jgi:hypothetical protein